jgi:hypothetical protein
LFQNSDLLKLAETQDIDWKNGLQESDDVSGLNGLANYASGDERDKLSDVHEDTVGENNG